MGLENPTIWIAFLAGIFSFVSPCVLPLVPAYISYLGTRAGQQVNMELAVGSGGLAVLGKNRLGIFLHGLFFVFGLSAVFVSVGLLTNISLHIVSQVIDFKLFLQHAGGILVVFFGLHILSVTGWLLNKAIYKIKWSGSTGESIKHFLERAQSILYGDTRRQINTHNSYGYAGSALMGVFFAAGWTPCIGPIYGAILTLSGNATTGSSFLQAGTLLLAYSLGLGVPFLLAAIGLDRMRGLLKRIQRRMRLVEYASGGLLIVMGILLYTGQISLIAQAGTGISKLTNLEGCGTGLITGTIPSSDFNQCMDLGTDYKAVIELQQSKNAKPTAQPTVQPTPMPTQIAMVPDAATVGLEKGQQAPDFSLDTMDGKTVNLKSLRGKVVLLNFWATWCTPCRAEMPQFQKLASNYDPKDFAVLAVDFQDKPADVKKFTDDLGLTLNIALDRKGTVSRQYEALQFPVSFVIGRDGTILARQIGPFKEGSLETALQDWVKASS